jgi:hypothetical protein
MRAALDTRNVSDRIFSWNRLTFEASELGDGIRFLARAGSWEGRNNVMSGAVVFNLEQDIAIALARKSGGSSSGREINSAYAHREPLLPAYQSGFSIVLDQTVSRMTSSVHPLAKIATDLDAIVVPHEDLR